ncbi:hypothetical protein [Natranaerofaba carboxydovora]|uniref:hypothetical protein n=1 Tax=Natranaerofaba carboxydovora TaxID=2742683 RepID=UPI001F12C97D|nr:hypothetical protein [Natranaerofaba carboxydovora]UMZ73030.1 hypothetical protein ACONDI_00574 [Natranaerofaba carboxydovora]
MKNRSIKERYSNEITKIENKLNELINGRIYELTKAQMDGYLSTNVSDLRENIYDLLDKIENNKKSINEQIGEAIIDKNN